MLQDSTQQCDGRCRNTNHHHPQSVRNELIHHRDRSGARDGMDRSGISRVAQCIETRPLRTHRTRLPAIYPHRYLNKTRSQRCCGVASPKLDAWLALQRKCEHRAGPTSEPMANWAGSDPRSCSRARDQEARQEKNGTGSLRSNVALLPFTSS